MFFSKFQIIQGVQNTFRYDLKLSLKHIQIYTVWKEVMYLFECVLYWGDFHVISKMTDLQDNGYILPYMYFGETI